MQEYVSEIEDPRHAGYVKHKLTDVLLLRRLKLPKTVRNF